MSLSPVKVNLVDYLREVRGDSPLGSLRSGGHWVVCGASSLFNCPLPTVLLGTRLGIYLTSEHTIHNLTLEQIVWDQAVYCNLTHTNNTENESF